MLNTEIRKLVIKILDNLIEDGPQWKHGMDIHHFNKRKRRGHLPLDWSLEDYNQLIVNIVKELDSETNLYFKEIFKQRYYVIGDKYWIDIIGEDGIMETAFPPNNYSKYLSKDEGYIFLGTVQEVRSDGL
ncbi:hypothetical protein [Bacillus benzoevorans]|uniref:Uncharacterized protein n=1 Tax=Bacillus benzoevorans TaxID=1456 RepID=A0A7X0LV12_9BACI|nr:hypothetical protein [Bacillus benzoevorans]MBB6444102.1 hypothetical protein [Bacillus benzoevorans]